MAQSFREFGAPTDIELFRSAEPLPGQNGLLGFELPQSTRPDTYESGLEMQPNLGLDMGVERRTLRKDVFKDIPITQLNAIVQARDEYEGIETLAEAIEEEGVLIHNPLVARFDRISARRYLNFVNAIYGNKLIEKKQTNDLIATEEEGQEAYYILIAGHRRIRALHSLGEEQVTVKVLDNIAPLDALYLQAQENTPKLLKDYERAEQHGRLWAVSKAKESKITHKEFSRSVGATEAIVRRDLRYYSLPDSVKNYVVPRNRAEGEKGNTIVPDQPLMPFTVACQLGRLVERGASEHDILFLARRFFEGNVTSEREASERVGHYIRDSIDTKFSNMVDLFNTNAGSIAEHRRNRQILGRFADPLNTALAELNRMKQARDRGFGDGAEDGMSVVGAASQIKKIATAVEGLLPVMENVLNGDTERIQAIMQSARSTAVEIEQTMGITSPNIFLQEGIASPLSLEDSAGS